MPKVHYCLDSGFAQYDYYLSLAEWTVQKIINGIVGISRHPQPFQSHSRIILLFAIFYSSELPW